MFGNQTFVVVRDEIKTINRANGQATLRELLVGKKRLYEMTQRDDGSIDTTRPISLDANGKPLNLDLFTFADWQQSMGDTPQLAPGSRITIDCQRIYASVGKPQNGQPARAFLQVEGEVIGFVNRTSTPSPKASTNFTTRPRSMPQNQDDGSLAATVQEEEHLF